jgi:hypothetical protein
MAPRSTTPNGHAAALQPFKSPSTEMDRALRRTHPKYMLHPNRNSATMLAAGFVGVLLSGLGWELTCGHSLLGILSSTLCCTMLMALTFRLFGGGQFGRRSSREQGHFLCEAAVADVLCDVADWWATAEAKQRWMVVLVAVVLGEISRFVTTGMTCLIVGLMLLSRVCYLNCASAWRSRVE